MDQTSGSLGWASETVSPLDTADHIQMCKFSGTEADPDAMKNELDVLAKRITDIVTKPAKPTSECV